jgi:hypothetical protein
LAGGVLYFSFPQLKGLVGVKTQQISQISELESQPQNIENPQEENSENIQPENATSPEDAPAKENPVPAENKTDQKKDVPKESAPSVAPGKIVSKLVPWGFQKSSGRTIKAIIVHTSYNALGGDVFDFDKVMQEWKDAGVSPHYAIDRGGTIYQLVADQNIAYHAGVSKLPDGTTDVNGSSIGIEIVNSQDAKFTDAQYSALNRLISDLRKKYPIKYVLGHDEIAPGRKTDPWGIDWKKVNR